MTTQTELDIRRQRADRQIALAKATGAKAHASADYKVVFIERRDGTQERVAISGAPSGSA
ncbi:MAG: hypothetical protein GC206_03250 [Alphaproteobacteria bacterium]|nr:hypothetical protein [Alphaproteobacteria bacterium]